MHKVFVVLWRSAGIDGDGFGDLLRERLPAAVAAEGGCDLQIFVSDSAVGRGSGLRVGPLRPDAGVSWWADRRRLDSAVTTVESALGAVGPVGGVDPVGRAAAWVVCESRPLRAPAVADGERCPGFTTLSCLQPRAGIPPEEFRSRWLHDHREVAIETQSTTAYTRNEILEALTDDGPAWQGIVTETFPLGALDDPHVFYDAVGDDARLNANATAMLDSVSSFLDLATVESHPMSEYHFGG